MTTLPSGTLTEISNETMKQLSAVFETIDLSRPDFLTVVQETDQWISDNSSAFNQSLSEPGRSGLTPNQKWLIFKIVADRRWSEGV